MHGSVPPKAMAIFAPVLDRLRVDARARFGDAVIEPVGYEERPFSYLMRAGVRPAAAERPGSHVFVKVFKPKDPSAGVDMSARVVQDFKTTDDIHRFMQGAGDLSAVEPIACYADLLAVVTLEAEGATLLQELEAHATWFSDRREIERLVNALGSVGRWLKRFQAFQPTDTHVDVTSLQDYVDLRLRRLADRTVISADARTRINEHLARLGAAVSREDLRDVAIHADLAPANILLSGSRIVLLDFAMAGRGTCFHDISRLHMQLELMGAKPQFRGATLEALKAGLLAGFDGTLTPRRPLFRFLSMLHHVNHLGTLALRRESILGRLVSARAMSMHRRWIARELDEAVSAR
jgi:hypothetical protein